MTVNAVSQSSATVDVSIKQTEVETSTYQQQVTSSQISVNEQILATQNSILDRNQTMEKDIQDQLSPPPTKSEQHGKTSIMVTDQEEVRKLESQLAATQSQIASAQSAVDDITSQQEVLKGENNGQQSQTTQAQAELSQAEAQASNATGGVNANASVTGSSNNATNLNGSTNGNANSGNNNGAIKETSAGTEAST